LFNWTYIVIKNSWIKKKYFFFVKFSKKRLYNLVLLKFLGLVKFFVVIKKNNKLIIKIYPFFFNKINFYSSIRITSTTTRKYFLSLKALKILKKKSGATTFLISTSKGIIDLDSCLKYRISGFLVSQASL